jgi:hypothetical protein
MSTQYLINNVQLGTQSHYAGEAFDSVTDATTIAALQSVGGQLFASTPALVAAAAQAQSIRLRGGEPTTMAEIMDGALDQNQQTTGASATAAAAAAQATANAAVPKASVQTGTAVLVAGTVSVAANITAASVVMAFPSGLAGGTPGSLSTGSKVVGAPGSFAINSSNALDTSTVIWLVIG